MPTSSSATSTAGINHVPVEVKWDDDPSPQPVASIAHGISSVGARAGSSLAHKRGDGTLSRREDERQRIMREFEEEQIAEVWLSDEESPTLHNGEAHLSPVEATIRNDQGRKKLVPRPGDAFSRPATLCSAGTIVRAKVTEDRRHVDVKAAADQGNSLPNGQPLPPPHERDMPVFLPAFKKTQQAASTSPTASGSVAALHPSPPSVTERGRIPPPAQYPYSANTVLDIDKYCPPGMHRVESWEIGGTRMIEEANAAIREAVFAHAGKRLEEARMVYLCGGRAAQHNFNDLAINIALLRQEGVSPVLCSTLERKLCKYMLKDRLPDFSNGNSHFTAWEPKGIYPKLKAMHELIGREWLKLPNRRDIADHIAATVVGPLVIRQYEARLGKLSEEDKAVQLRGGHPILDGGGLDDYENLCHELREQGQGILQCNTHARAQLWRVAYHTTEIKRTVSRYAPIPDHLLPQAPSSNSAATVVVPPPPSDPPDELNLPSPPQTPPAQRPPEMPTRGTPLSPISEQPESPPIPEPRRLPVHLRVPVELEVPVAPQPLSPPEASLSPQAASPTIRRATPTAAATAPAPAPTSATLVTAQPSEAAESATASSATSASSASSASALPMPSPGDLRPLPAAIALTTTPVGAPGFSSSTFDVVSGMRMKVDVTTYLTPEFVAQGGTCPLVTVAPELIIKPVRIVWPSCIAASAPCLHTVPSVPVQLGNMVAPIPAREGGNVQLVQLHLGTPRQAEAAAEPALSAEVKQAQGGGVNLQAGVAKGSASHLVTAAAPVKVDAQTQTPASHLVAAAAPVKVDAQTQTPVSRLVATAAPATVDGQTEMAHGDIIRDRTESKLREIEGPRAKLLSDSFDSAIDSSASASASASGSGSGSPVQDLSPDASLASRVELLKHNAEKSGLLPVRSATPAEMFSVPEDIVARRRKREGALQALDGDTSTVAQPTQLPDSPAKPEVRTSKAIPPVPPPKPERDFPRDAMRGTRPNNWQKIDGKWVTQPAYGALITSQAGVGRDKFTYVDSRPMSEVLQFSWPPREFVAAPALMMQNTPNNARWQDDYSDFEPAEWREPEPQPQPLVTAQQSRSASPVMSPAPAEALAHVTSPSGSTAQRQDSAEDPVLEQGGSARTVPLTEAHSGNTRRPAETVATTAVDDQLQGLGRKEGNAQIVQQQIVRSEESPTASVEDVPTINLAPLNVPFAPLVSPGLVAAVMRESAGSAQVSSDVDRRGEQQSVSVSEHASQTDAPHLPDTVKSHRPLVVGVLDRKDATQHAQEPPPRELESDGTSFGTFLQGPDGPVFFPWKVRHDSLDLVSRHRTAFRTEAPRSILVSSDPQQAEARRERPKVNGKSVSFDDEVIEIAPVSSPTSTEEETEDEDWMEVTRL